MTLDRNWLNSLYVGGKLNAAQREALVRGADPRSFGVLSQYELWHLTRGALGSPIPDDIEQSDVVTLANQSTYTFQFKPPLRSATWTLTLTFQPDTVLGGSPGSWTITNPTASGGVLTLSSAFTGTFTWLAKAILRRS